jgi:hypothetical protein
MIAQYIEYIVMQMEIKTKVKRYFKEYMEASLNFRCIWSQMDGVIHRQSHLIQVRKFTNGFYFILFFD